MRAAVTVAALSALAACGQVPADHSGSRATAVRSACLTTVHGVVAGHGSLMAGWLPRGFRPQTGTQYASSLPMSTYVKAGSRTNAPRIGLDTINQPGPLSPADGPWNKGVTVAVDGHKAIIESGPPNPRGIGVYWKPGKGYVVSVTGSGVPASVVLRVARNVSFVAPGIISLPVTPGRIVTRNAAITAAEHATGVTSLRASAKLTSWTEIDALATEHGKRIPAAPPGLSGSPWRPDWAVLLAGSRQRSQVVVVDAASGLAEFTISGASRAAWFAELTDRDPARATRLCPGGSSALVPFGVLTRDEQADTVIAPSDTAHARTTIQLVLSTVPAVNKADNGLYGGCVQQNCSIRQLVWVTIGIVRARPGQTVACLPGAISVPPGYKAKRVKQYFTVSVPDNYGIGCGRLPGSLRQLKNLAPAQH